MRIQARQRGRVARRELEHQNNAARTVQARQRGRVAQREFAEQRGAATRIQAMQRGKAGRLEYQRVAQEESAATRIQARHRGMQGRRAAHELLHAQGLDVPSEVGSEEEHVAARDVVAARVAAGNSRGRVPKWCSRCRKGAPSLPCLVERERKSDECCCLTAV